MDILFLTHRLPYPPNRGDRIRSYHLLRFLASQGRVSLGCLVDETPDAAAIAALQSYCTRIAYAPVGSARWARAALSLACGDSATKGLFRSPCLSSQLRRWGETTRFDAIVVFCSSMLQYVKDVRPGSARLVVDLVDSDSQKWFDYAAATRGFRQWLLRMEGRRVRRLEQSLPACVDAITLVSPAEAELYRSYCPNDRTWAVANGVDLEYYRPISTASEHALRCAFVGVLDYKANVDGLLWFCSHVWPGLRRRLPTATLAIIGRRPVAAISHLGQIPGVEVIGEVADIRPHVAAASVMIAPLQVARGIQNKVLEALAMMRPVVASPQAIEGLAVVAGIHVAQATTTQDWVQELSWILTDAAQRRRLAEAGRSFVEQHHNWDACLAPFAKLLIPARGKETGDADERQAHSTSERMLAASSPQAAAPRRGIDIP